MSLVPVRLDDSGPTIWCKLGFLLGFPVGPRSGPNFRAAPMAAGLLEPDARIVTAFPGRMERDFSTELFRRN